MAETKPREPVLNAPSTAIILAAVIILGFVFQTSLGPVNAWAESWGLVPRELFQGQMSGLVTALLVHGGWAHALMNAVAALTFAAPVARLLSGRLSGGLVFCAFYIACGVLAGLAYALLHPDSGQPLIGASGAVFGLIGASTRLIGRPRGEAATGLRPLLDRQVVLMLVIWILISTVVGLLGLTPGSGGAAVAWEAHIAGLLAGWLMIGPVAAAELKARRVS